jgi:putative transposase
MESCFKNEILYIIGMEKFRNKYRISSTRLRNWDYGSPGLYFITICTKNREHYFGEIGFLETRCIASLGPEQRIASLRATEIGKIATIEWIKTPEIRPDMNLELGEFVVMPDHFHGIVMIGENDFNSTVGGGRDAMHRVSTTTHRAPTTTNNANKFGSQSKNLASIIRGFKSSVTTYARKNKIVFQWQERFHDHIIRDQKEYQRISNYIVRNPSNWKGDSFFI